MNAAQSDFLSTVVPAAQYAQRSFGIPASITIAQAVLESGWGESELAKEANNFFGIKAAHYMVNDSYAEFSTAEYVDGHKQMVIADFMRYASPQMCFGAHARLLALAPRYRAAMQARLDPAVFAVRLQDCGYSTNPRYSALLMQLVKEFDLTQYDVPPPTEPAQRAGEQEPEKENEEKEKAA